MGGFSLVEILVTLGIFTLIIGSVAYFAVDSFRASRNAQMRVRAIAYVQEVTNALIVNKEDSWLSVANASDGSPKHVVFTDGTYSLAEGAEEKNGVTISILVEIVYRDATGNIVTTGGTEDPHSRAISISASWIDLFGNVQNANSKFYVNDWNNTIQRGRCLRAKGCRGKETHADCPTLMWNGINNWCIGSDAPCSGCTEPLFYDGSVPLYIEETKK